MLNDYTNDLQVARAYLNGDRRIEQRLYHELKSVTYKLIKVMQTRGFIFPDPENVVSEVIYRVMVKDDKKVFRTYQGKSQLSTYLWSIIRNQLINAMLKEKRHLSKIGLDELPEKLSTDDDNNNTSQLQAMIEDYIENEPPFERFVKYAKWMQELSYHEIISQAQSRFKNYHAINVQHIAYILHTNRKNLKKKLKIYTREK